MGLAQKITSLETHNPPHNDDLKRRCIYPSEQLHSTWKLMQGITHLPAMFLSRCDSLR